MTQVVFIIGALVAVLTFLFIALTIRYSNSIRKKQAELYEAVLSAQTEEQHRIGRDLHDQASPLLAAIGLQVSKLQQRYPNEETLADISELTAHTQQNIREASHNLMPDALLRFGPQRAIEGLIERIKQHSPDITFSLELPTDPLVLSRLSESAGTQLYRMLSEALHNALKHAAANRITVILELGPADTLRIVISDNGKGFDPDAVHSGIGLRNIRSRARLLRGNVEISSAPKQGSTFIITLPLQR